MIPGDVDGCGALGAAFQRAARGCADQARQLAAARAVDWSGTAADAFRSDAARQVQAAEDLAGALGQAGRALAAFAAALAEARSLALRADQLASEAGLPAGPPAPVPMGPYATPEQATAAARAERRHEVQADVSRLLQAAAWAEQEAHDRLNAALRCVAPRSLPAAATGGEGGWQPRAPGLPDWTDLVDNLVLGPRAFAERALERAGAAGEFASLLKAATRTGSTAERALARQEWRAALRDYRALNRTAQEWSAVAEEVPAPRWLIALDRPLSRTVPVLKEIPIAAVLLTGVSTVIDHDDGMSWGLAATKNVASTGAGLLVYAGAGAALTAVGLVGAPVVILAVGLGFAASWGVGQVVEHYGDDIEHAAGAVEHAVSDAAGAVGSAASDAADAVGDAAGSAWHSVFG